MRQINNLHCFFQDLPGVRQIFPLLLCNKIKNKIPESFRPMRISPHRIVLLCEILGNK